MRAEVCRPGGGRARACGAAVGRKRGAHAEDPRLEGCGSRARAAERTPNMAFIFVTRDVSKLTSWLKAVANCRVESRACDAGRGVRAGRRGSEGVGQGRAQAARTRRTRDWRAEGRARGARPMSNPGGRGAAAGASNARGGPVALEGCVGARHARRSARRT